MLVKGRHLREEESKRQEKEENMEKKKGIRKTLLALLLVGSMLGFGYGMSEAVKHNVPPAASAATVSEPQMIPANFTDLAKWFVLGSSISRSSRK